MRHAPAPPQPGPRSRPAADLADDPELRGAAAAGRGDGPVHALRPPARPALMREIAPGVAHWTARHEGIGQDVSCYWLADERVLLNPLQAPEDIGEPVAIVLTNGLHDRDSARLAERFGCPVRVPREGVHRFADGDAVEAYADGDAPAPGLVAHRVGALSDDEYAVEVPRARALAIADGVIRVGDGPLRFVPDSLMGDDPEADKRGVADAYEALLDRIEVDHLLLAHGDPVIGDGGDALRAFLRDFS